MRQDPYPQSFVFSQIPPSFKAPISPYRAPSFTTPRQHQEIDFSSGPENASSPDQADNEDTPEAPKPPPVTFIANNSKPAEKRNSLFGIYGRFAPSSGRGEIHKTSHSNALVKRVHKRRRRDQNLGRQLVRARQQSADTTDDDDDNDKPPAKERKHAQPSPPEVGYITGLFTFIENFPNAPSLLAKYLQLFLNSTIILGCLYAIYCFWTTIQADVNRASEDAAAETLAEMAACAKSYVENRCAGDSRLPALETVCSNWELCMNRDPNSVKRASLSAHTFAEILNSFVEPISLKTMIFTVMGFVLFLGISNATFSSFRRSHDLHHHPIEPPRYLSGQYPLLRQPPPDNDPKNPFDFTAEPGHTYGGGGGGQQFGIGDGGAKSRDQQPRQDVHALEYWNSPSRRRDHSPEKRMPLH